MKGFYSISKRSKEWNNSVNDQKPLNVLTAKEQGYPPWILCFNVNTEVAFI